MPDNMKQALNVISDRDLSPLKRADLIQDLGFNGPQDLADKLSGRIEGLKMAQKAGLGIVGEFTGEFTKQAAAAEVTDKLQKQFEDKEGGS
jgi:hypothetical protein